MNTTVPYIDFNETVLETLRRCNGFYDCPKDANGKRLGPLVGYAGKYDGEHHFVGDVYANFAKLERFPHLMQSWATRLIHSDKVTQLLSVDTFCAAPFGGLSFADKLAMLLIREYIYTEKKIIHPGTERETSKMILNRHEITKGSHVAIVEDVTNNFSTTDQLIELITKHGGEVTCIVSMLNRSTKYENEYVSAFLNQPIPIISLARKIIPQFQQDDPEVAADIAAGNVVFKPKDEWDRLATAVTKASS